MAVLITNPGTQVAAAAQTRLRYLTVMPTGGTDGDIAYPGPPSNRGIWQRQSGSWVNVLPTGAAADDAGNGLIFSGGQLAIRLDGNTLALSAAGIKIADGGVGTAQLANQAVTAAKIANSTITGTQIKNDSIFAIDLKATNSPSDGQVATYDSGSGGVTWEAQSGGGTSATESTEAQARQATDDAAANATRMTPRRTRQAIESITGPVTDHGVWEFDGATWVGSSDTRGSFWATTDTSGAPDPANRRTSWNAVAAGAGSLVLGAAAFDKQGDDYLTPLSGGPTDAVLYFEAGVDTAGSGILAFTPSGSWTQIGAGNAARFWANGTYAIIATLGGGAAACQLSGARPSGVPMSVHPTEVVRPPWPETDSLTGGDGIAVATAEGGLGGAATITADLDGDSLARSSDGLKVNVTGTRTTTRSFVRTETDGGLANADPLGDLVAAAADIPYDLAALAPDEFGGTGVDGLIGVTTDASGAPTTANAFGSWSSITAGTRTVWAGKVDYDGNAVSKAEFEALAFLAVAAGGNQPSTSNRLNLTSGGTTGSGTAGSTEYWYRTWSVALAGTLSGDGAFIIGHAVLPTRRDDLLFRGDEVAGWKTKMDLARDWRSGWAYRVGQFVRRPSDKVFLCKTANSDTTFTPSRWIDVTATGGGTPGTPTPSTITGVSAGDGLQGGGTSGNVTLSADLDGTTLKVGSSGLALNVDTPLTDGQILEWDTTDNEWKAVAKPADGTPGTPGATPAIAGGDGIEASLSGGNVTVSADLGDGLEIVSSEIAVDLDGNTLARGSSGLRINYGSDTLANNDILVWDSTNNRWKLETKPSGGTPSPGTPGASIATERDFLNGESALLAVSVAQAARLRQALVYYLATADAPNPLLNVANPPSRQILDIVRRTTDTDALSVIHRAGSGMLTLTKSGGNAVPRALQLESTGANPLNVAFRASLLMRAPGTSSQWGMIYGNAVHTGFTPSNVDNDNRVLPAGGFSAFVWVGTSNQIRFDPKRQLGDGNDTTFSSSQITWTLPNPATGLTGPSGVTGVTSDNRLSVALASSGDDAWVWLDFDTTFLTAAAASTGATTVQLDKGATAFQNGPPVNTLITFAGHSTRYRVTAVTTKTASDTNPVTVTLDRALTTGVGNNAATNASNELLADQVGLFIFYNAAAGGFDFWLGKRGNEIFCGRLTFNSAAVNPFAISATTGAFTTPPGPIWYFKSRNPDSATTDDYLISEFGLFPVRNRFRVLQDGEVGTAQLADDAVTAAKIADDAIVAAAIDDDAVTSSALADDAVTRDSIADGAIEAVNLESTNTPTDNQLPSFDSTTGGFTWIDQPSGGGTPGFTTLTGGDGIEVSTSGGAATLTADLGDGLEIVSDEIAVDLDGDSLQRGSSGIALNPASDTEFATGTSESKAPNVKQVVEQGAALKALIVDWDGLRPPTDTSYRPPAQRSGNSTVTAYDPYNRRWELAAPARAASTDLEVDGAHAAGATTIQIQPATGAPATAYQGLRIGDPITISPGTESYTVTGVAGSNTGSITITPGLVGTRSDGDGITRAAQSAAGNCNLAWSNSAVDWLQSVVICLLEQSQANWSGLIFWGTGTASIVNDGTITAGSQGLGLWAGRPSGAGSESYTTTGWNFHLNAPGGVVTAGAAVAGSGASWDGGSSKPHIEIPQARLGDGPHRIFVSTIGRQVHLTINSVHYATWTLTSTQAGAVTGPHFGIAGDAGNIATKVLRLYSMAVSTPDIGTAFPGYVDFVTPPNRSIPAAALEATNTPTDNQLPSYDSMSGGVTWIDEPSGGGGGGGFSYADITTASTGSWTGLTATTYATIASRTVTLPSTSDQVLLLANVTGDSTGTIATLDIRLRRGTTDVATQSLEVEVAGSENQLVIHAIDAPASTSEITYNLQLKRSSGSSGVRWRDATLTVVAVRPFPTPTPTI